MSDFQNTEFPEGTPGPLSNRNKKILFISLLGALSLVFGLVMFSGGSKKKTAEKPSLVTKAAAAESEDYEVKATKELASAMGPKADTSVNPLKSALERQAPPGLSPELVTTKRRALNQGTDPSEHNDEAAQASRYPSGNTVQPAGYHLTSSMQERLDEGYQRMVSHFKDHSKSWALDEATMHNLNTGTASMATVPEPLRNLVETPAGGTGMAYAVPSGSRLIAVTDGKVSSDHPGFFTATIVRPFTLKGAKLICQSGANVKDRIAIQPVKVVLKDSLEVAISGQVETDFPGFDGDVTTHYMARLGPAITNAAIGGGFAAWALTRQAGQNNIDTRDAIVAPVVQSSVEGLQNEITRMGGDFPNTVMVPAGKQFSVLITEPFNFKR